MNVVVTEKQIENQALTYLSNKGFFVWKNQSVGVFNPKTGGFQKSRNNHHINGVSDILGITRDGRFIAIEVKRPYFSKKTKSFKHRTQEELEKMASEDQVSFINKIKARNGIGFYIDTLEVLEDQLYLWGLATKLND